MPQKKRSKLKYNFHKYFILPFKILRISIVDTVRQDGIEHAGYLAFLSIFSLFPFLIFLISIVSFFGESEAGLEFIRSILSSAPEEMIDSLAPRINEIAKTPPKQFLTIAIIGVIWTASSSVEGCRTILNRAYRIESPPPYLWRRFISILEFFVITFSMVAGVIFFVILPNLIKKSSLNLSLDYNIFYFNHIAIFALLCFATSLLYYALPNAKQRISQTVPGSLLAVTLWIILKKTFAIYLGNFQQFNFIYGSLAGMMISLMFFYLISIIFILGAEFNYHFHRTYKIFLRKS